MVNDGNTKLPPPPPPLPKTQQRDYKIKGLLYTQVDYMQVRSENVQYCCPSVSCTLLH